MKTGCKKKVESLHANKKFPQRLCVMMKIAWIVTITMVVIGDTYHITNFIVNA